jgi:hypothetical protein
MIVVIMVILISFFAQRGNCCAEINLQEPCQVDEHRSEADKSASSGPADGIRCYILAIHPIRLVELKLRRRSSMSGIGRPLISLLTVQTMRRSTSLWRLLLEHAERLGRGDDRQRVEIVAKRARLQLVGGVLDPAVLFLLVEVGLLIGRAAVAEALLVVVSRRVGLDLAVLAVLRASCASVRRSIWFSSPWLRKNSILRPSATRTSALWGRGMDVSSFESCPLGEREGPCPVPRLVASRRSPRSPKLTPAPGRRACRARFRRRSRLPRARSRRRPRSRSLPRRSRRSWRR